MPCRTKLVVRALRHPSLPSRQSGFTIVEALVAIIVASALMVAIAPVVAMSVAARVQARRVDLATQAAKGYIEGLRANAIDPPTQNRAKFIQANLGYDAPSNMRPVQGVEQCLDKNLNQLRLCNSSDNFMVIQAFRDGDPDPTTAIAQGYCVGVRVYRAEAFNGGAPTQTQPTKSAIAVSLSSKNYPLVVMKTQIINKTSFDNYQKLYLRNPNNPSLGQKLNPTPCN